MKTLRALFGFTLICSAHCSLMYGQISSNGPALSAAMEGGSRVALSWPKSATGFALEYRSVVSTNGNWTVSPESPGIEGDVAVVRLMATNAAGFYRLRFVGAPLPPDPSSVAPPLAPAIVTDIGSATSFLYSGTNAIQTGVTNGTIQAQCAAAIRGVVRQSDGQSLPGVTISIQNHLEYGQTLSRADGRFDLAVNGGGALAVKYEKSGFLPAQRTVQVPWQDFVEAPEVGLIAVDSVVTPVTLGSNAPLQVARGSAQTDGDGTRQATVLLPAAVGAALILPNGTTQTVASLNIRATEYTVGDQGPNAMPANLPPTSAYTYCVELSADEAVAAGATTVEFDQPLPFYVENFLGMPVGVQVPTAYYDKARGAWTPTDDGRVIQILSVSNGLALLDVTGSGLAADAPALSALGITPAEQRKLAELYSAGASLWRVGMQHFSSYDCNYSVVPQAGAALPNNANPQGDSLTDSAKSNSQDGYGSLELENQIFRESVGIVGTSFSLHYASDRVPGRNATMRLDIPLSGTNVPGVLKRITLEVSVAGRTFTNNFPPQTNLVSTFVWDGHDVYGRTLNGAQPVLIRVGYVYNGYYALPPSMARTFGAASGELIPGDIPARREVISWQEQRMMLGHWVANGVGLGGWTLSVHHAYDPNGRMIYYGDGRQRNARNLNWTITTIAGTGISGFSGDGGPATQAQINSPCGVKVAPDGSVLIADSSNGRIRRIDPNGIIQTIAGGGSVGDNIPATQAKLDTPLDACAGPDGSVYVLENNGAVRRVRPDGIIVTIAPDPAELVGCGAVEVAPDGTVYVGDWIKNAVRRITADGTITTVAGTGVAGFSGDGGPAVQAQLNGPAGVALGPDGSLYIACIGDRHVRRVTPDGIITTVAGDGSATYRGDGGPATQAGINDPTGVAIAPTGDMFISLGASRCVRRVTPDGIISTFAGNGVRTFDSDEGPATRASLMQPHNICVGPDGAVYFPDYMDHRVRKVTQPLPGFGEGDILVPSEDGTELYHFDPSGRHLRTLYGLTGAEVYRFEYNSGGLLTRVTDAYGNVTQIVRGTNSEPTAITAPFGQLTRVTLTNGYLATLVDPAGETNSYSYDAGGLLTDVAGPRNLHYPAQFGGTGRLQRASDPADGSSDLTRQELGAGHQVTMHTAEGRLSQFSAEWLPTGDQRLRTVFADGTSTETLIGTDQKSTVTAIDGTVSVSIVAPDPQFGMLACYAQTNRTQLPSGLTQVMVQERTAQFSIPGQPLSLTNLTTKTWLNGRLQTTVYNASNHEAVTTSPLGRQTWLTKDELGRIVRHQVGGLVPSSFDYDSAGRLVSVINGTGTEARSTRYFYNARGDLASVVDALGSTNQMEYDSAERLVRQTTADGRVVHYAYDGEGNVTMITPPGSPEHHFTFTPVNLQADYVPPAVDGITNIVRKQFNRDRQLTQWVRGNGQTVSNAYNAGGLLATVSLPTGTYQYTYGTNGLVTAATSPDGITVSHNYDGYLVRTSAWTGVITGAVTRVYDSDLRLISLGVGGAAPVTYGYDADGYLTNAGVLQLQRDAANGALTQTILSNLTDHYTYNGFGEVTRYAVESGGNLLFEEDYVRDALGRLTERHEVVGGATNDFAYVYDAARRLAEVWRNGARTAQFQYDANGNRLQYVSETATWSGTFDDQDRLRTYGPAVFAYNGHGELTNKTAAGQSTQYQFDALGSLRRATLPDGTQVEWLVDGQNRRVAEKVNGVLTRAFLYHSSLSPLAELDARLALRSLFVYASHPNVPDYTVRDGVAYRLITDRLGSVRLVVNALTGEVVQRLDYDESGRVTADTQPGFQPFGFAGGLYEPTLGLVHFGSREYDAETGRWLSRDPTLFAGGELNLYAYAGADPVNYADRFGLGPEEERKGGLQAINNWMQGDKGVWKDRIFMDNDHAYTLWDRQHSCVDASVDRSTALQQILNSNYSQNGDWTVSVITASHGLHTMNMVTYRPHGSSQSYSTAVDNYLPFTEVSAPVTIQSFNATTATGNTGPKIWVNDGGLYGTRVWVLRTDAGMPGTRP